MCRAMADVDPLNRRLVEQMLPGVRKGGEPKFASWNQLDGWLRQVEELRRAG